MDFHEFIKKSKDLIEIEFYRNKQVIPKLILSEENILDFMEARQFQKQANGLIVLDFTFLGPQLGGGVGFKNFVAQMMQDLREKRHIYLFVSEAYYYEGIGNKDSPDQLQAYLNEHGTLENHPDRFDCMMINYFDGENIGIIVNKIVNAETDKAFLTQWNNPDPENKADKSGRFIDNKKTNKDNADGSTK